MNTDIDTNLEKILKITAEGNQSNQPYVSQLGILSEAGDLSRLIKKHITKQYDFSSLEVKILVLYELTDMFKYICLLYIWADCNLDRDIKTFNQKTVDSIDISNNECLLLLHDLIKANSSIDSIKNIKIDNKINYEKLDPCLYNLLNAFYNLATKFFSLEELVIKTLGELDLNYMLGKAANTYTP